MSHPPFAPSLSSLVNNKNLPSSSSCIIRRTSIFRLLAILLFNAFTFPILVSFSRYRLHSYTESYLTLTSMSVLPAPPNSPQAFLNQGNARSIGWATYFRIAWLDYLCITVIASLTLGLYYTPMYYKNYRVISMSSAIIGSNTTGPLIGFHLPLEVTYPWVEEPLPTWGCALVVVFVPLLVIAIFQLKTWSLWDFHAGVVGVLKAVVSATFVCTILKHFVGGFRPHYIERCKPDWTAIVLDLRQDIYRFNATACTEKNRRHVDRALQAFPSGHTASSFAAAIFLALYLNAKLKVFSDHASDFWAFMVVIAPLILASLVSASMYTSHQHQAHDLIFGMILGLVLGMLAYRSAYATVFDFRYNHIPLPPFATKTQFSHSTRDHRDEFKKLEEEQAAGADELVVWSWWKQPGAKKEEKEKEMAWLRSITSLRVTGREVGSKANPRIRLCSQEAMVQGARKLDK